MGKRTTRGVFANVLRNTKGYKNWVLSVFFRDKFTCQDCGYKSSDPQNKDIEAHHINAFENIVRDFLKENSKYDVVEDKKLLLSMAYVHSPFWDVDNGKTLCKPCHDKLDNIGYNPL